MQMTPVQVLKERALQSWSCSWQKEFRIHTTFCCKPRDYAS